jgi:hypothetical protein
VGKILHSPHPHARIRAIYTAAARRLPGVKAVVTGDETPVKYGILPVGHDETIFVADKVRYIGDNVAGVAAETEEVAGEALRLIKVEHEVLPAYFDPEESMKAETDLIPDHKPHNIEKEYHRVAKGRDELVTGVRIPASSVGWSGAYKKLRIRQSIDYPLAGVAAVMRKDAEGYCLEARLALTAVNPAPRLVNADLLRGKRYDPALVEQVAHEAIRTGKPLRTSASTPEYRRHMLRVFVRRALQELWLNNHPAA